MGHVFKIFKSCILQSHTQMTILTGTVIPRSMLIMTMNVKRSYAFREESKFQNQFPSLIQFGWKKAKVFSCFCRCLIEKNYFLEPGVLKAVFLLNCYTNNRQDIYNYAPKFYNLQNWWWVISCINVFPLYSVATKLFLHPEKFLR